jgi:SM-20-related protein
MLLYTHDCFVTRSLVASLFDRFNQHGWVYGWKADVTSDAPSRHWHIEVADSGQDARQSCLGALACNQEFPELVEIWRSLATKLPPGHQPTRVYANAHTFGVEGKFHTDCKPGAGEMTSLIYLNPVWRPAWGGDTLFAAAGTETPSQFVCPAPGRLVIFAGDIPHRACAPSRECHDLRVTLVFKSRELP